MDLWEASLGPAEIRLKFQTAHQYEKHEVIYLKISVPLPFETETNQQTNI